ncbi:chlorohydrolase [Streptococcus pneumoniae]|nr:chlorohydrolase [Streptococcus pneumoniae]
MRTDEVTQSTALRLQMKLTWFEEIFNCFEVVDRTDEVTQSTALRLQMKLTWFEEIFNCFEVVDRTDEVRNIYTARRR